MLAWLNGSMAVLECHFSLAHDVETVDVYVFDRQLQASPIPDSHCQLEVAAAVPALLRAASLPLVLLPTDLPQTYSSVSGLSGPARVGISGVSGGTESVPGSTSSHTLYLTRFRSGLQPTYIRPS